MCVPVSSTWRAPRYVLTAALIGFGVHGAGVCRRNLSGDARVHSRDTSGDASGDTTGDAIMALILIAFFD